MRDASNSYYLFSGLFVASVLLPVGFVFGILCAMAFGDSAANVIGRRFGTHPVRWEPQKSWEGTATGFALTVLSSWFFVGVFPALVLGVAFVLIDVVTPTKVKISDNFAYPLLATGILAILAFTMAFETWFRCPMVEWSVIPSAW